MRVNRRVSIWKHVRLADGKWRYCRPVLDAKGKIVPNMVLVDGREVRHDEGTYVTLTDILGSEDAFGDMDFKVAGTKDVAPTSYPFTTRR